MDVNAQTPSHLTTQRPISQDRLQVGKFLYRFAWVIEIFAIIIGLAIALMTMTSSFTEMKQYSNNGLSFGDYTSIFIAAVPFLMVAVVEATKIPFVEAYYKTTQLKWKILFGVSLLFIALITFESAINGFERNFNALMYGVDKYKKELVNVNEKIPPLKEQREKLSAWSSENIEKNYNDRNAQLSKQRQEQSSIIQERIEDLRATTRTEYVASLKEQVKGKKSELDVIYKDRKSDISSLEASNERALENASSELTSQRRTVQSQLSQAQVRLLNMEEQSLKEIDDASIFSVNQVEKKWERDLNTQNALVTELRNKLNDLSATSQNKRIRDNYRREVAAVKDASQSRIDQLNQDLSQLNLEISKSVSSKEKEIEKIVSQHQQEQNNVEELFFKQQKENKDIRIDDYKRLSKNKDELTKLDNNILSLEKERVKLRNNINIKVGDNQIYRMAQWFWGKESAADIDRKEVIVIASIWFGSLAFLIAFTGIILALASFVIRDNTIPNKDEELIQKNSYFAKLIYSIRRWVYYGKKMQRRPIYKTTIKEIVKEVPVDRVVFRDKPIEILKKEIVHVPLYTNDTNLINLSNKNTSGQKEQTKIESVG
jgi:hypothetical protein